MNIMKMFLGLALAVGILYSVFLCGVEYFDNKDKEEAKELIAKHCSFIGVTVLPEGSHKKYNVFQCDKNELYLSNIRFPEEIAK